MGIASGGCVALPGFAVDVCAAGLCCGIQTDNSRAAVVFYPAPANHANVHTDFRRGGQDAHGQKQNLVEEEGDDEAAQRLFGEKLVAGHCRLSPS